MFTKISDSQHAFMLLRQVKYERHENVQIYAERLLSLANHANEDVQYARVTEGQLLGFFIQIDKVKSHERQSSNYIKCNKFCKRRV